MPMPLWYEMMMAIMHNPLNPLLPRLKPTRSAREITIGISSSTRPTVAGMKNASTVPAIATSATSPA